MHSPRVPGNGGVNISSAIEIISKLTPDGEDGHRTRFGPMMLRSSRLSIAGLRRAYRREARVGTNSMWFGGYSIPSWGHLNQVLGRSCVGPRSDGRSPPLRKRPFSMSKSSILLRPGSPRRFLSHGSPVRTVHFVIVRALTPLGSHSILTPVTHNRHGGLRYAAI